MVISKFYPPSNRQESISIDEIEDSSMLRDNRESMEGTASVARESASETNNIKIEEDDQIVPRDTSFKKKVPDFMDRGKTDWMTASKENLINDIKKSLEENNKEPETVPDFYWVGKMLGKGAFGKVNLGMHKLTDALVAIKSINKEFLEEEWTRRRVVREVSILKKINHQNIVRLYETYESVKHFLIVIELCSGGDLLNYVWKRRKLSENYAKYFFKQLVDALMYCHKKGVVHWDIKLDNILLDHQGKIKLCDFGVSRAVKWGEILHD